MNQFSREIEGARDFELGIERTSKLTYHCAAPADRAKGLVFVISGFGEDASADYSQILRRYLCARHGLVAVMVAYHACQLRPPACGVDFADGEFHRVIGHLATLNIPIHFKRTTIADFFAEINRLAIPTTMAGKLIPPNGDYQNFGVMQAIDHLCALNDILDSGLEFDRNNILCVGSSHGAYIAHLIHKFAPNTINGIVDNSGYAIALMNYIGAAPEYWHRVGCLTAECTAFTRWNHTDSYAPEFFGPARFAIRDAMNPRHLSELASKATRRCQFRMVNSYRDRISRIDVKQAQHRALRANGFDAQLRIIRESHLDGVVFKTLEHGMDASIHGLFDRYADSLSVHPTTLDRDLETSLTFECYDHVYRIRHRRTPPYFEAFCERIQTA